MYKFKDEGVREKVEEIITTTCNSYLEGITMKVAGKTALFWDKD